jgi:hypothetical protein
MPDLTVVMLKWGLASTLISGYVGRGAGKAPRDDAWPRHPLSTVLTS